MSEVTNEWQRYREGHFKKEEKGPLGQDIKRTFSAPLGWLTTYELFSDSYRRLPLEFAPDASLKPIGMHGEARFLDKKGKSLTNITIYHGDLEVLAFKHEDPVNISSRGLAGFGAGLQLVYDKDGNLSNCILQAESVYLPKEEEPKNWKENISVLVNLAKTAEEESLPGLEGYIYGERATVMKRIPKYIIDKLVKAVKKDIPEELIEFVDPKDIPVLDKIGFFEYLAYRVLGDPYETLDDNMDEAVQDLIDELIDISSKNYQRLLEIKEIKKDSFVWREVDLETGDVTQERRIIREGENAYGTDIPIERNRFTIVKNDGEIAVTCTSQKGDIRWVGKFPFSVPVNEIVGILDDPKADFRRIKEMLGIQLTFH